MSFVVDRMTIICCQEILPYGIAVGIRFGRPGNGLFEDIARRIVSVGVGVAAPRLRNHLVLRIVGIRCNRRAVLLDLGDVPTVIVGVVVFQTGQTAAVCCILELGYLVGGTL